jgi:hypothetical protein
MFKSNTVFFSYGSIRKNTFKLHVPITGSSVLNFHLALGSLPGPELHQNDAPPQQLIYSTGECLDRLPG